MPNDDYAPDAIKWLGAQIVAKLPTAELSGIVGDLNHTYGYHRARAVLPSSDYSVQLADDRQGDKWAASAIDIKCSAATMKIVTRRLIDSAEDPVDPRMIAVREFYGTTNGVAVNGRIHNGNYAWNFESSDDSHLWHFHIGILRKYSNNKSAMSDVLSVVLGDQVGHDMEQTEKIAHSATTKQVPYWKGEKDKTVASWIRSAAYQAAMGRYEQAAQFAATTSAIAALADGKGADPKELRAIVVEAVDKAIEDVHLTRNQEE